MRSGAAKLALIMMVLLGMLGAAMPAWMQGDELVTAPALTAANAASLAPLLTVNRASLHPDHNALLHVAPDGTLWFLDLAAGTQQVAAEGLAPETRAIFGPQEGLLTTYGGQDGRITIGNYQEGRLITEYRGHGAKVEDLTFGYDAAGQPQIVSWDFNGDIHVWNALTGATRRVIDTPRSLNHLTQRVFSGGIDFSFYTNYLIVNSGGHLWSVATGEDIVSCLQDMVVGASEAVYVCWDIDAGVIVGDPATGQERRMLPALGTYSSTLFFLANDDYLATSSEEEVILWNVETGEELQRYAGMNATLDPTRTRIVYQDPANVLQYLDLETGEAQSLADMGEWAQYDQFGDPYDDTNQRLIVHGNNGTDGPAIRMWDLATGKAWPQLQGSAPILAARLSANGQVFAALETDQIELWDAQTGVLLKTIEWVDDIDFERRAEFQFSADGRFLLVPDDEQATWIFGVPGGQPLASAGEEPANLTLTALVGYDNEAHYGAQYNPYTCPLAENDLVLLVGHQPESTSHWLAYTAACEGPVWLYGTPGSGLELANEAAVSRLPVVVSPDEVFPLDEFAAYESLCESATEGAAALDYPLTAYLQPRVQARTTLPAMFLAAAPEDVDVVVCTTEARVEEGTCHYHGDHGQVAVTRYRTDLTVSLVEASQGQLVARQTFQGSVSCPGVIASNRGSIVGDPPEFAAWRSWLLEQLTGQSGAVLRTVVGGSAINARSDPSTSAEVLEQLPPGTPLSLIGRNEAGDWVAALTPRMDRVWVALDLLRVAVQTDVAGLPVVSGPAAQVPIPLE